MNLNLIEEEILNHNFKIWHTKDYDNPKKEKEIMGDMPEYEVYLKNKNNLQKELLKITPELRQFYCEPLLTIAQEYHLFRKLNFMKYKLKKYHGWFRISKTKKLEKIILNYAEEIINVRNLITCCNTRLASLIIKKRKDYYNNDIESLISDCFFNILKAVDGFDFTRTNQFGRTNKFSTYCTWVLLNNSLRDHSSDKKFRDSFSSNLEDGMFCNKTDEKESAAHSDFEYNESIKSDIGKVLGLLEEDYPREMYIIKNYYGINQEDRKTLKEISEDLGLTKERVRQLRENALAFIQQEIQEGSISLSTIDD